MILLLGTATAFAQTTGSSSTSSGATGSSSTDSSSSDTSRRNQSGTTSGSTGSYDTGSATGSRTTTGTRGDTSTSTSDTGASSTTASRSSDKLSWGDRRFVSKAAEEGHTEKQIAELAAQRATNPEVKSYAQKLVQDHSKVNSELKSIASQKNVDLDIDDDKDRAYKRLNKQSGSEFDQEFVEHMIDAHEKDIKMYEKAASDAKDSEIRSFASKHVASLREHLQQAQSLQQSLVPTGRTDGTSGRSTSGATTGSGLGTSSTDSRSTSGTSDTSGTTGSSSRDRSGSSSSSGTSGTSGTGSSSDTTRPNR